MRLIDADHWLKTLESTVMSDKADLAWRKIANAMQFMVEAEALMFAVDAVPVVRCRDCRHKVTTEDGEYNPRDIVCDYWESDGLEETDFCSYGERRTDG